MRVNLYQRSFRVLLYSCISFLSFAIVCKAAVAEAPRKQLSPIPISEAVRETNSDLIPDRLGQEVVVEGVLTSDPVRSGADIMLVNLQDPTAGVLLLARHADLFKGLHAGDYVRVRGTVSQYKGAEQLVVDEIERQGTRPIPPPKHALAADLRSKRYLAQRVDVVGEVYKKPDPETGTTFVLRDRSGEIPVFLISKVLLDEKFVSRLRRGGKTEVVGVLGQYSERPPFNSGFRVVVLEQQHVVFAPVPPYQLMLVSGLAIVVVIVVFYISRRRRRLALDAQRRLLDAVVRQMPSAAVIADADTGKILFRNEEAARLWQGREALLERFTQRALSNGATAAEEELEFPSHEGTRWLRVATAAIRDHKGRIFAGVVTCYDLTEIKRAEATLRVAEKVAVTGRLAATIAHEINNPLAAVTNLLYLVYSSPELDQEVRQYVSTAQQELARVAHIVKQTLSFYHNESTSARVQVTELIDSAISVCSRQAESRQVRIYTDYMPVKEIRVFANEIRQLLCNILLNAIEAANHSVRIRVYESRDWHDPFIEGIRISIADDGQGISRENLDQIFEPFFTTKGVRGTGLGLWVGRNIVQKHGGEIYVKSCHWSAKSMTCFSIFLPYEAVQKIHRAVS